MTKFLILSITVFTQFAMANERGNWHCQTDNLTGPRTYVVNSLSPLTDTSLSPDQPRAQRMEVFTMDGDQRTNIHNGGVYFRTDEEIVEVLRSQQRLTIHELHITTQYNDDYVDWARGTYKIYRMDADSRENLVSSIPIYCFRPSPE
jgi:hypothetical protein